MTGMKINVSLNCRGIQIHSTKKQTQIVTLHLVAQEWRDFSEQSTRQSFYISL